MRKSSVMVVEDSDLARFERARGMLDKACQIIREAAALTSVGNSGRVPRVAKRVVAKPRVKRAKRDAQGYSTNPAAVAARKRRALKQVREEQAAVIASESAETTGKTYDPTNIPAVPEAVATEGPTQ